MPIFSIFLFFYCKYIHILGPQSVQHSTVYIHGIFSVLHRKFLPDPTVTLSSLLHLFPFPDTAFQYLIRLSRFLNDHVQIVFRKHTSYYSYVSEILLYLHLFSLLFRQIQIQAQDLKPHCVKIFIILVDAEEFSLKYIHL